MVTELGTIQEEATNAADTNAATDHANDARNSDAPDAADFARVARQAIRIKDELQQQQEEGRQNAAIDETTAGVVSALFTMLSGLAASTRVDLSTALGMCQGAMGSKSPAECLAALTEATNALSAVSSDLGLAEVERTLNEAKALEGTKETAEAKGEEGKDTKESPEETRFQDMLKAQEEKTECHSGAGVCV